jgi:Ca2+-binding EF-hand superfamily protein
MSTVSSASSTNAAYQAYKSDMFKRLDADGNGSLTKEEATTGRPSESAGTKARSSAIGSADTTSASTSNSPESLLSGEAMAVLMLMKQQGGFSFGDDTGSDSSADYLSQQMDADGDGAITQAEFVSSRPADVSEEDATTLFKSIDTEGEGSLTADQLNAGMKAPAPPPPGGSPPVSSASGTEDEVFDALDANQDGVVSEDEFLAFNPAVGGEDESEKQVSVNNASLKGKLLDELMERLSATRAAIQQGMASEADQLANLDDLSGSSTSDTTITSA